MIVADILSLKGTTLFTVNPDMMLSDAVLTMDEHDIGSVAVMENGAPPAGAPQWPHPAGGRDSRA